MGTPTSPAAITPAQAINLFPFEDLEDDIGRGKLVERDLRGLRAIADWIKTFEARSHLKLVYFNDVGESNHVAAWQEPNPLTRITNNGGRS